MPVEISIVQVMSLGALIAGACFLVVMVAIGLWITRKVLKVVGRFQSVGAERVNGRIQMKGLFTDGDAAVETAVRQPSKLTRGIRQALDFTPSPEDLQHLDRVEGSASSDETN
jgi:hypothetical protein